MQEIKNNKQRKYGIFPIRKCKDFQQKMIKEELQTLKDYFQQNKNASLNWVHVYLNEKFCFKEVQKQKQMKKWADQLVSSLQNVAPQYITSIGYIKNPIGGTKQQLLHFDYDDQYKCVFIPMTHLVYQNSPRFFSFGTDVKNYETYVNGITQNQILDVQGVDFLVSHQIISKPYVILKMESGTIHRGVLNRTNQDRYMFFIGYYPSKKQLDYEEPVRQV